MPFFKNPFSKKSVFKNPLVVDMHSHLLPGIDDGAEDLKASIEMIKELVDMGYKKLITTPHIMGDFFKNTPDIINAKLAEVKVALEEQNIPIQLEAAAEYYLDEWFIEKLEAAEPMLTFGDNYLLFETSYINKPRQLEDAIFKMKAKGLQPIMAHPERYTYLYSGFEAFQEIYEKGVYFQINANSLTGYYNKPAMKFAQKLIDEKMVQFLGSDCHADKHLTVLKKAINTKHYQKASTVVMNNTL